MILRIAPKHETSRHLRERARDGIKANLVTMLCGWRESSFHNQFPTRRDEKGMKLVRLIKHENYIAQWVGQKSGMLSHCQVTTAVRCRRGKAKLKSSFKSSLELFSWSNKARALRGSLHPTWCHLRSSSFTSLCIFPIKFSVSNELSTPAIWSNILILLQNVISHPFTVGKTLRHRLCLFQISSQIALICCWLCRRRLQANNRCDYHRLSHA